MPSYHEGLPIALLEAMSYNLKTVVSVIPANLEVGLGPECYFETGNTADLVSKIAQQLASTAPCDYREILLKHYNWETIAAQTIAVYRRLVGSDARPDEALGEGALGGTKS
jgi:glycosyltransferase involved in cell wall biosynthesis